MLLSFSIFTILLYLASTSLRAFRLINCSDKFKLITTISEFFAIAIHGALLFSFIYYYQNLNLFKLISLAIWFINFIIYLSSLENKSIQNLGLFTSPIAAFSLLLLIFFNHDPGFINITNPKQLFHIILSTLTFTAIFFGALQASVLAIQDRKLRKYHRGFTSLLPSIESMETFLFQILTIGFLLLTMLLLSSLMLFFEIPFHKLINKFILSFFAWIVLAVLLGGRLYSGWRGSMVTRWTLLGTSLLMLIYFGSLFSKYIVKIFK